MSDPPLPVATMRGDYEPSTTQPKFTLFSPTQIGVAGFLGGPIAAAILLGSNLRRQAEPRRAIVALLVGVVATIALGMISMALPDKFPGMAIPIAYALGIYSYAKHAQGPLFEQHLAAAGKCASSWAMVGIAVAALAVTLGIVVGVFVLHEPSSVSFGDSDVYYRDGGTQAEAQAVGAALVRMEYIKPDQGVTVTVERDDGHHVVALVVKTTALVSYSPLIAMAFSTIAADLSKTVFHDEPVDIWLNDDENETKRKIPWAPKPASDSDER